MKGEVSGILYVVILYGRPKCKDSSLLQTSRLNATLTLAPALIPYSFALSSAQEATLADSTLPCKLSSYVCSVVIRPEA